ncbi:MAG: hypothetical protein AB7H77_11350, partial [Bdellovibrionales bacterium]
GSHLGFFFRPDVPFFFYLGALLRHKHIRMTIPFPVTMALIILYICLAAIRALAPYAVDLGSGNVPGWLDAATRAMRLVGVLGCWGLIYRLAETKWGDKIADYGGLSFFLFAAHWPLLAFIKILLWPWLPAETDFWMLVHYVLCVTVTVTISLFLGAALARKAPKLFALMNGGRDLERPRLDALPKK